MVITISYNKQTWNEYNDSQTADENLANGAIISADRLNHMETGISNNDINKVTDNKNGTIEVNGSSIIPADDSKVVHTADTSSWQKSKITDDAGMPLLMLGGTDDLSTKISGLPNGYFTIYCNAKTLNNPSAYPKRGIIHITAPGVAGSGILFSEDKNAYIITMLNGTVTYTKLASDSTVVHNLGDETIGDTKTFTNPIKGTIDGITYRYSAQGDDLTTSYMNDSVIFVGGNQVAHAPAGTSGTWAIVRNYNSNTTNGSQSYYDTNQGVLYVRTRYSTSTYTPWIQVADDSKVAHLSGANNFDTVPTYGTNNKPFAINDTGATTARPTGQAVGYQYFDTTLNKPIWYNGTNWVDSTGTTV